MATAGTPNELEATLAGNARAPGAIREAFPKPLALIHRVDRRGQEARDSEAARAIDMLLDGNS